MNTRARVWRPTQGRGSRREVVRSYEVVHEPTRLNARPAPIEWRTDDNGPGEASGLVGQVRRWFLLAEVDVARFDVIEMTDGPEAGRNVRVLDASFPHSHSKRVVVEPYTGELPEAES